MAYWLDLFTWTTWQEFLKAGGTVSGFRKNRWKSVQRIKPGDIFICYMTGVSRFFALLEVIGTPYLEETPIWQEDSFPCRLPVKILLSLAPEYAVPVFELQDNLSYFQDMKASNSWTGHFRGSPTVEKREDAEIVVAALTDAEQGHVYREFDTRKLERKVPVYATSSGPVTIPDNEDLSAGKQKVDFHQAPEETPATHSEIQWLLLYLGEQMKLDLWVASNDKNKSFAGNEFNRLSGMQKTLPVQFNAATNRTIELIDVLWLQDNNIIAAFEIEHTSAIYSGLLRMADLVAMQPNIKIPLYIVAPDERRDDVRKEINRPIFAKALKTPLPKICRFIPYSALKAKIDQAYQGDFLQYLKPEFIDKIAENVEIEEI